VAWLVELLAPQCRTIPPGYRRACSSTRLADRLDSGDRSASPARRWLGVHLQHLAAREGALIVPSLSIWCVRMALLYLGFGFTLGALMLSSPVLGLTPAVLKLRPLHVEILLVGWMAQLAFGVAYWILPRLPGNRPRGSEQLAWLSLALLNAGVVTVGLGRILNAPTGVLVVGRVAEALAVFAFAIHAWSRGSGFHRLSLARH
jgi:hypothetical protein